MTTLCIMQIKYKTGVNGKVWLADCCLTSHGTILQLDSWQEQVNKQYKNHVCMSKDSIVVDQWAKASISSTGKNDDKMGGGGWNFALQRANNDRS